MSQIVPITLRGRQLRPHKAIVAPVLSARTVLTGSPWEFVSLWLKREKHVEAEFYWDQASAFHDASEGLPTQSAPLLLYYSFMNAAKALLSSKNIDFVPKHGVRAHNIRGESNKISITNEGIKILNNGIAASLSRFFEETEGSAVHSLQELLFNLPYIHRTYCLTYSSQTDLFVPLKGCEYVVDKSRKKAFFRATLSDDFANKRIARRLPDDFTLETDSNRMEFIRSTSEVDFSRPQRPNRDDLTRIRNLNALFC